MFMMEAEKYANHLIQSKILLNILLINFNLK